MNKNFDLEQYWSDIASVLVHMKRFQKATTKYRRQLGIPTNGFSQNMALAWYKSLMSSDDIDTENRLSFESTRDLLPPNKYVVEQIESLANEFNLDERWYIDLLFYLMSDNNNLSAPFGDVDINTRVNDQKLPLNKQVITSLSIEINKDTSLKDIERIWTTVKKHQSKMKTTIPKRRRMMVNTQTYIKIRNFEDQHIPQKDIPKKIPEIKNWAATDVANFKRQVEKRFKPQKK